MAMQIHIIAPYQAMIPVIKECIPLFPELSIEYSVGDLNKGVEIARELEKKGIDVIISRGGTAQLIKQSVIVPVIDIQLSGYDMIRSLTLASNLNDKTAIVGFPNITSGAQSVIELMDFSLQVYTISKAEELPSLIVQLKNMGYKHIVGDVITMRLSNANGLNGFLIQSGKESIIKAVEDAKMIIEYLKNKNKYAQIMERLLYERYKNIVIINEEKKVILEHLEDFQENPITKEQQSELFAGLASESESITKTIKINDDLLKISCRSIQIDNQIFIVFIMEKSAKQQHGQQGITIENVTQPEAAPIKLNSLEPIIHYIEKIYNDNKIIALIGGKGTGKECVADYIHQQHAGSLSMMSINLLECDMKSLEKIPLENIGSVKLLYADSIADASQLKSFIVDCRLRKIRVFILSEQKDNLVSEQVQDVNIIMIPSLSDRKQDIGELAKHFLFHFHQRYGTTAVKFQNEALELLKETKYPNNIDDLQELIKQLALNEKGYVINEETVTKAIQKRGSVSNQSFIKGTLKEIEKEIIQIVLEEENYNQTRTAERLGINRATLWRKLKD